MASTSSFGTLTIGLVTTALATFALIVATGTPNDPDFAYLLIGIVMFGAIIIVAAAGLYALIDERSTLNRRTAAHLWLEAINDQLHRR